MKPKIILTTIPSDAHNWNLIFMQLLLEEFGFEVLNLGPCVSFDLLENTCTSFMPDAMVVSTINGHGYIEGKCLIKHVKNLDSMTNIPVFMGGKLSTDTNLSLLYAIELEAEGFTKAYYDDNGLDDFARRLKLIKEEKFETFMLNNLFI
jgi:methylaspartate mutase sigma subunit